MTQQQVAMYPNLQQIENGQEEIPLQDRNNDQQIEDQQVQLDERRQKIWDIFQAYDLDRDNQISLGELKLIISSNDCQTVPVPRGLAKKLMRQADVNNDRMLNFEEFYELSLQHDFLFRDYCVRYVNYVVPSRKGRADEPDGAYEDNMVLWPPPLTMVIFSIIEVAFFFTDIFKTGDSSGYNTSGPMATLFIYNPSRREEVWRFLTYMFVHIGYMHLVMNLLIQIFLGVALELVHSWWRVSLVYLAGVLAGSMGTSLSNPNIYLAGASGGVYALITAHIATIIMNWKEMEYAVIQLFVFLVFCVTDLTVSIYNHIYVPEDKIGYVAHLSGAIAGLLVGIGVLRNLNIRNWEKKLWWCAVTLYLALMATGIVLNITGTLK